MDKSSSKRSSRVFFSYSTKDKKFAQKITERIKDRYAYVGYDGWELKVGDSILDIIKKRTASSDYIIILLSPNSVKSKWIKYELSMAFTRELTKRNVVILPVVIADCEIPMNLEGTQLLDLRKGDERDIGNRKEGFDLGERTIPVKSLKGSFRQDQQD